MPLGCGRSARHIGVRFRPRAREARSAPTRPPTAHRPGACRLRWDSTSPAQWCPSHLVRWDPLRPDPRHRTPRASRGPAGSVSPRAVDRSSGPVPESGAVSTPIVSSCSSRALILSRPGKPARYDSVKAFCCSVHRWVSGDCPFSSQRYGSLIRSPWRTSSTGRVGVSG